MNNAYIRGMEVLIKGRKIEADILSLTDDEGNEFVIRERQGGGIRLEADGDIAICPSSVDTIDIYEI